MNFLHSINWVRHRRQYQKKFDALMWLSRYRQQHHGRNVDVTKLCRDLHITHYQYDCVLAGSPLVTIPVCNRVIAYLRKLVQRQSLHNARFRRRS